MDINEEIKVFDKYVQKYDPSNLKIALKINHIKRVTKIAKKIATELKLSEEDIELAELIGLLHDIGRFEQVKRYNTFIDKKSVNHGEFGVKLLFEDGLIRDFIKDDKYDNIIKKAILNHNKGKIQEGLNERELVHSKIIRDADKTDIFYVLLTDKVEACYDTNDMSKETITPEIYNEYMENRFIDYSKMKTSGDLLVAQFAYIYDLNFKESLKILKEKNYINLLYERFTFNDEKSSEMLKNVFNEAKKYLDDIN